MAKKISLPAFIDAYGITRLTNELGTSRQTVYDWQKLNSCPRPHQAHKIIEISNELVSYESIYAPYVAATPELFKNNDNKEG